MTFVDRALTEGAAALRRPFFSFSARCVVGTLLIALPLAATAARAREDGAPPVRKVVPSLMAQSCAATPRADLLPGLGAAADPSSTCCSASGGIGCDDTSCTDLICSVDPVCCTTGWDQICADEAAAVCSVCGGSLCPGTESCCQGSPNKVPKCDDPACCSLVCDLDPACCVANWDGACSKSANALCTTCGGGNGDCCSAHTGVGCSVMSCTQTVCAEDPLCCTEGWDAICAAEAVDLCPAVSCQRTLSVTKSGTGSGSVTGTGIACPGDCSESYPINTAVMLTASPVAPSSFAGWTGDCAGSSTTCNLTMSDARSVTATFNPGSQALTVSVNTSGGAAGRVTATGIDCPGDCSETYAWNTQVTLTAAATAPAIFTGWSGACTGTASTCQVTMSQARSVTATFTPPAQTLSVAKVGTGTGSVTASGIACPGDCTQDYAWNTQVTLTASATSASTFAGWSGDCAGTAATCQVTMSQARSVTANFDPPPAQTLTVAVNATGGATGSITAIGINCPGDCNESYTYDTVVTLTEVPGGSSVFTGWSGACAGSASTCQVTMSQARSVTASFTPPPQALGVTTTGTGIGTVTASGIACPGDCGESYAWSSVVTLTASATAPSSFTGWSGDCAGSASTCQVTMSQARSVTATFTAPPVQALTILVNASSGAAGSVTATGITCPGDCTESYTYGTVVTLTAAPAAGAAFTGWGGACTGTALTCQVTLSQAIAVSAGFAPGNALFKDGFEAGNACAWSLRSGAPCP